MQSPQRRKDTPGLLGAFFYFCLLAWTEGCDGLHTSVSHADSGIVTKLPMSSHLGQGRAETISGVAKRSNLYL